MGIVRDVTVDQLTQAVGNIDTSSLAQDSTLQDVVTAIGNISGGSDPVTNTTVNSLCKDTTGQSIASAISGLGTALGSDRVLIDGSNIGNKATFRNNIEASKLVASNILLNSGQTITAGTGYNVGSISDLTNGAITNVNDLKSLSVIYMAGGSGYDYTAKVFAHASLNTIRVVPTITQSDVTIRISLGF